MYIYIYKYICIYIYILYIYYVYIYIYIIYHIHIYPSFSPWITRGHRFRYTPRDVLQRQGAAALPGQVHFAGALLRTLNLTGTRLQSVRSNARERSHSLGFEPLYINTYV